MSKKNPFNKELQQRFLEALEANYGIVQQAANKTGMHRSSHYRWMEQDPEYAEKVRELKNVALDFAEHQLLVRIQEKSDTALIFYLKTQGKSRGYVERQEVVGTVRTHRAIEMSAEEAKKFLDDAGEDLV